MSNRFHQSPATAGLAVAAVLALGIVPAAAQAAPVNLATANPFVVLGGAEVTNTGPSVLKGALGVSPGTSLTGFALPATVLGATHDNDAVASQAQADLTNAFGVAGGQAVPPGNELTGIDLGGLTLTPGAYNYSSSAQLTGQLTLDAQGNPNAQFVFIIGSTLTTASASSVKLINGASPCNVYWRIGSSATFGTTTQFQGNVLAHQDISVNEGVHVDGRLLAGRGITLINDVLDNSQCERRRPTETGTTTTSTTTTSDVPTAAAARAVHQLHRQVGQGQEEGQEGDRPRQGIVDRHPRRPGSEGHHGRRQRHRHRHGRRQRRQPDGQDRARADEDDRQRHPRHPHGHGPGELQGQDPDQDHDVPHPRPLGGPAAPARGPLEVHRMTDPPHRSTRPSGIRRGVLRWALPLLAVGLVGVGGTAAATAAEKPPALRPLVVLLAPHTAHVRPVASSERIETVASRRPLTKVRTVLPVLGAAENGSWLRVRLPGRPNGHTGWIPAVHSRTTTTEWSIEVDLSARRVDVFQQGTEVRQFPAVVGKASTPTPKGHFFVEEALSLSSAAPGAPYALATSARSNVLQEFDGGPGQIALHGRAHLAGALGTAASHGCVRLGTAAIAWLARRIGAGTPLIIHQ